MEPVRPRVGSGLLLAGLGGGLAFFLSLGALWPLAAIDLVAPHGAIVERARAFLVSRGFDLAGYRSAATLAVAEPALDYVERAFGREQVQQWIAEGVPLFYYRVEFKKRGDPVTYAVRVHPAAGVVGWSKTVPDDYPGPRLPVVEARLAALAAIPEALGLEAAAFAEHSSSSTEHGARRTHEFVFERKLAGAPELEERVTLAVSGAELVLGLRWLHVPEAAERRARAAAAPRVALEMAGFVLLGIGAIAACGIFLRRLRDGTVLLGRAVLWPGLVFACLLGTWALETPRLFRYWEPLWPKWISDAQYLAATAGQQAWLVAALLAVVAAGDVLDRDLGGARGASLWALARGRVLDPDVAVASGRGFLVGLLCGGVMAAAVHALGAAAGATTGLQPRGFFFYTLNTASPALASVLFFFGVALAEELGYRFFAGSWLLARTGWRSIAVVVPALVYGLAHTRMEFLPPAEPFWTRALVLALVGCVWGWAFFRYDALTVVLSHFTADLFIFNWPRLASGRIEVVAASLLTISVPLLPFLVRAAAGLLPRARAAARES